ncbi:PAS domain S-box protein [Niveibacterium umoris]|uniref:histidine kinase n=1 Tax=Niveibacterium umoris TaxID=1193620 RepID=A0A840BPX8_9RHOO|nr:PAS domain S-box protein [Niveibacterium umoris]MBB4012487.1 two-component system sensor histidine kinase DctS [Niveibacterium umoris]
MDSGPRAPSLHASEWYWRLPALALLALAAGIVGFVVLTLQQDREDQRATLVSDVLWLEQNLRFQFERNEGLLNQLAPDLFASAEPDAATVARLRQLTQGDAGFQRVVWVDARLSVKGAWPPELRPEDPEMIAQAADMARAFGRPGYGYAETPPNEGSFAVATAWHDGHSLVGYVIAVYALRHVLSAQVPWWFSERYRLSVLNQRGVEVAAKSQVAALLPELSYELPFDPPGHGLTLKVEAYRNGVRLVPLAFAGAVIVFAAATVWSLLMLRRHMRRRQHAEQALRHEMAVRKAMEDSLLTGLRARDLQGRITYVNPAFCRMFGWSAEEMVGMSPPMPYWLPDDLEHTRAVHDRILAGNAPSQGIELRFRRKNGEKFDALLYEAPLIDADGRQTGWMGSVLDITERRRAEELARQQQEKLQTNARLVTMGEMASSLAHELNQPLAAITSYATGALNALRTGSLPPSEIETAIEKLAQQATRAGQIIRRVHDFVRKRESNFRPTVINAAVKESFELVQSEARRRGIRLEAELSPDLPPVHADSVMLEQVLVNLIRNGFDAMRDTPAARRVLSVRTALVEGWVRVSVTDHGAGIAAEVGERLFDALFTTKAEGMGMGLNICRSIVELHHGRLWFEPNPGGGTVFQLTLPIKV